MTAPHPRAARGFTVVEVLAALSIFAFAAVMMASAYLNVLNSYEAAARGAVADEDFAFARQQLLREPEPRKLEEGGEFETAGGRRAKWSAEIAPTSIADVYRVTFSCELTSTDGTAPERRSQSFLLLRPTWVTDPGVRGRLKEETKTRILELKTQREQEAAAR